MLPNAKILFVLCVVLFSVASSEPSSAQCFSRGGTPGNIAFPITAGVPDYAMPQIISPATSGYALQQQAYAVRQMMAMRQLSANAQMQRQYVQMRANYQQELLAQRRRRAEKYRQQRAERAAANRVRQQSGANANAPGNSPNSEVTDSLGTIPVDVAPTPDPNP